MDRPRVNCPVDAVAETHDSAAGIQTLPDVVLCVLLSADFLCHLHDLFSRATVRRTLKDRDACCDRAMQVRNGRCRDSGAERGCVNAMLGVEDKVLVDKVRVHLFWKLSEKHVQEVRRLV